MTYIFERINHGCASRERPCNERNFPPGDTSEREPRRYFSFFSSLVFPLRPSVLSCSLNSSFASRAQRLQAETMSTILILMPVESEVQARESTYVLDPPASKRNENVHYDERNLPRHVPALRLLSEREKERGESRDAFSRTIPVE